MNKTGPAVNSTSCAESLLADEAVERGVIEFLSRTDVPTVANAIELYKVRTRIEGFAPLTTRCLFPELGPMSGFAVTVHAETSTACNSKTEEAFIQLFEAVDKSPKPAVVVFQETGPLPDFAVHSGEIMATIFKRLGATGLVSDCAVRDVAEVRALGFHYFARGLAASHANFRIVRTGIPVYINGLLIKPEICCMATVMA